MGGCWPLLKRPRAASWRGPSDAGHDVIIDYADPDVAATIRGDVCIVGAGAAGITLACALVDSGLDIVLLESGGFDPEPTTQNLYEGESTGQEIASPLLCRLRYFGGTTNHWQGWCAPLSSQDFAQRGWIPDSGWPITREELDPFYEAARKWCEIGPAVDPETVGALPAFNQERLVVNTWQYSPPTHFGQVYRERLLQAKRVQVYLHCNVTRIITDANAHNVTRLEVATLDGKRGSVDAGTWVLACGGMENTRMLLLTSDVEPAGLGNRSGTLGRFFMQHIEAAGARVASAEAGALAALFQRRAHAGGEICLHPAMSGAAQSSERLLGTGFSIMAGGEPSAGMRALRGLWHDTIEGRWPDAAGDRVIGVLSDLDGLAGDLYRRARGEVDRLDIGVHAEQSPNPASRIELGSARDALGLPQVRVDWRPGPFDRQSIDRSMVVLAAELARLGLGRLQLEPWLREAVPRWPERLWSGCHHMGTTRMSADPTTGIVDVNVRLHTVGNLYIAGSSVFPTGGYVPPTLTIVALALRLAKHLKELHA